LITEQGTYADANAMFKESLAIFEELGDRRGAAYVLYQLSTLQSYTGAAAESWESGQRSLAIFRQIGDQRGVALCQIGHGTSATDRGDYDQAQRLLHDSLAICEELGDHYLQVYVHNQLGAVAQARGAISEAEQQHRAALAIARQIDDAATIGTVLAYLGQVVALAGDAQQARAYYLDALALCVEEQSNAIATEAAFGIAGLVQDQAPAQAIELLQVTIAHPASFSETRDQAQQLLDQILARLPLDQVQVAVQNGATATLETVTARLLAQRH